MGGQQGGETDTADGTDDPDNIDASEGCDMMVTDELHTSDMDYEQHAELYHDFPLYNDVVMNCFMNYVHTADLPNCRFVCKAWAGEAWRQLTKRKCISFKEASMKQFVQFMEIVQVDNIHFSKLHFSHFTVNEYRQELTEFFASAGSCVKELTLNFVDKEITLEELENVFLSSVPQLEFLALDRLPCDFFAKDAKISGRRILRKLTSLRLNTRCHYNNDEDNSTVFFMGLLRLAPNLHNLNGAVDWCLPRLVAALSTTKLSNLSNLVLKGCWDCPTAQALAASSFNLKTLYLGTSGFYDLGKDHNIIYAKRHTLRALGLGWASFMRRIDLETISEDYKSLTCLSLCDSSKWTICESPYSGPGLKRLFADIRKENDFEYLEKRPEAFKDVCELNLSFLRYQLKNTMIIRRIACLFPALRLLTLKIPQEFPIKFLWAEFPDLEELTLCIDSISATKMRVRPSWPEQYFDEVFTGLGAEECERLRNSAELLHRKELQPQASILNMKNLRKFSCSGGYKKISHLTASLCISKLKCLTAITLCPVTDSCEEVLQKSLPAGIYADLRCG